MTTQVWRGVQFAPHAVLVAQEDGEGADHAAKLG
jgi:hypothetical protein